MNSIWLSLLWKEWCEFRWKMAALTAILVSLPIIFTLWFLVDDGRFYSYPRLILGIAFTSLSIFAILAGTFVGMSVAAGENSRCTMRFLQALPISLWQAALVKLLVAILTVSVPVLILMGVIWLLTVYINDDPQELISAVGESLGGTQQSWGISNWFVGLTMAGILGVSSILVWMVATGANRSDEVRAGAIGFLAISAIWGCLAYGLVLADKFHIETITYMLEVISVALPGAVGMVGMDSFRRPEINTPLLIGVAVLGHALIVSWYLRRFGRVAIQPEGRKELEFMGYLSKRVPSVPLRTQAMAIAWKQVHETGPLALFAVIGILVLVPIIYWANQEQRAPAEVGNILGSVAICVGILVTLVSGIGVLLEDYAPGVNNFWRSRPINLHAWFAIKYVAGFAVLAFSFGPLLIYAATLKNWEGVSFVQAAFVVAVFLGIYTIAVAGYSLLRQPIFTAILTFCAIFGLIGYIDIMFPTPDYFWVGLFVHSLGLLAIIILAWQAVVRDWGWKQSR